MERQRGEKGGGYIKQWERQRGYWKTRGGWEVEQEVVAKQGSCGWEWGIAVDVWLFWGLK